MKLRDLGEFGFIERVRQAVAASPELALGIGDDCAAGRVPAGHLLLTTTDLLIEGAHFHREWTDLHALGRKSISVNVSDVAAMGGRPTAVFLALGIPEEMTVEELDRFTAGVLAACRDYRAVLAGGDTCRSPQGLFISVTAQGVVAEGQMVTRAGARINDLVWVSGTLGDSALVLRDLLSERLPPAELLPRHHDPTARAMLGQTLAEQGLATAMIDVSDGLLADLGHILDSSGVGAVIEREALPLSSPFAKIQRENPALIDLAVTGGEDYELLFTSPPDKVQEIQRLASRQVPLTKIGRITPQTDGLKIVDAQGKEHQPVGRCFDHFG